MRTIQAFLEKKGVPTIDVAKLIAPLSVEERIVNPNDAHPSKAVHALVATAIEQWISGNHPF